MRVLLLCTVVFGALETGPLLSFSGTFSTTATFNGAYLSSSDGSCSLSSSYYYQSINYTFPTAGVRTINTYNIDFVAVTKNASYDLGNLCNSAVTPLLKGTSSIAALYPFGHWFDANVQYTFILGGSSGDQFVAEVWNGIQGQTAVSNGAKGNKTWLPLSASSGTCEQAGTLELYDTQVMTVSASGVYNVFLAFAQNVTLAPNSVPYGEPSFAIIQGDVSGMDLSTANCSNVMLVTASEDNNNVNSQKFFVSLSANQTYTFVISSGYYYPADSFYFGHYSLTVSPAIRLSFTSILTWTAPTTGSCSSTATTCTADSRSSLPYGIANFTVPANSFFYVHASQYQDKNGHYAGSQDLSFYLFRGVNSGPLTCGGLSSCIDWVDSLDGKLYTASAISQDYTLIVQNYYNNNNFGSDASSDLYVMGGLQIGLSAATNAPTSRAPSGGGVTNPPSSTAPSSNAPSSNAPSSNAPSSTGGVSNAPSSTSASKQPTVHGVTFAPSTVAPTPVGYTYAPSTAKPQDSVNSGDRLYPGLFLVALVAFGWM